MSTRRPFKQVPKFTVFELTLAGSTAPFAYSSPLGDILTLGDLNVRGGAWTERNFDTVSNLLLCNHNCWVLLEAFRQANELAFVGDGSAVPALWRSCLDFIANVFEQHNWQAELEKEKGLLDLVAASELRKEN